MKCFERVGNSALWLTLLLAMNALAQQLVKENLGANVNSQYDEIGPIISADGRYLYFVRDGSPQNVGGAHSPTGSDNQDIWFCERLANGQWSEARNIGQPLNTRRGDAIDALSPDGNTALVMGTYRGNGNKGKGSSISRRTETGWSFPDSLVIRNYYNLNRYVSVHQGNDGKTLIFSLNRRDTIGKTDLYVSFLLEDQSWSEPLNLGAAINTQDGESTPFLASDGVTLYFNSDGHAGYGSYDMFVARRLDSTWTKWSEPQNLGAQINSANWDGYYTIPASGEWAYFVSYQTDGFGKGDIFRIALPDSLRPTPVVLVRGTVKDPSGKPLDANISYGRLGSGKEMGRAISNPANGEFSVTFPFEEYHGKQDTIWYAFHFTKDYFLPVHKNLDLRKQTRNYQELTLAIVLQPLPVRVTETGGPSTEIVLENVFFELNKFDLKSESFEQLDFLADSVLAKYPTMEVVIAGHTDSLGTKEHNDWLSQKRAEAVVARLADRGIARKRLKAEWHGPLLPITSNDTEEGRQKNRRVTFQIVKLDMAAKKN